MRQLLSILIMLAAFGFTQALAQEEGFQAKITSTITITDEFVKLALQGTKSDVPELGASDFEIEPVSSIAYWTKSKLRMDSQIPMTDMVVTTIVDFDAQRYMILNHAARMAWAIDFASFKELEDQLGVPVNYPDQVFLMWDEVVQRLRDIPGIQVKELGTKKINGEACRGIQFTARVEDVVKTDGFAPIDTAPAINYLTGKWTGEYWLAERLGLPMKMHMRMLGVEYTWSIDNVQAWEPHSYLLSLPRGYKVQEVPASMLIEGMTKPAE